MIPASQLADFFLEAADTLVDDFDILDFYHSLTKHAAAVSGAYAAGLVLSTTAVGSGTCGEQRVRADAGAPADPELRRTLPGLRDTGEPVINADLAHAMDRWPTSRAAPSRPGSSPCTPSP